MFATFGESPIQPASVFYCACVESSEDPFELVAERFCKGLEVAPAKIEGGYRGAAESPLEGEWLGGYSTTRMLEPFSAMRVMFARTNATGDDDAGPSTWIRMERRGRSQEWLKSYPNVEWLYRGQKQPHAFVGAWTSPSNPAQTGCFWLVPASQLSDAHANKLRRGAARRWWPAIGAQVLSLAMVAGSVLSIAMLPWWLAPLPFGVIGLALKDGLRVPTLAAAVFKELDQPEFIEARVVVAEAATEVETEGVTIDELFEDEQEASSSAPT